VHVVRLPLPVARAHDARIRCRRPGATTAIRKVRMQTPRDADGGILEVRTFLLFFSYCRINAIFVPPAPAAHSTVASPASRLEAAGLVSQTGTCTRVPDNPSACEITIEAMVNRDAFPGDGAVILTFDGGPYRFDLAGMMDRAVAFNLRSLRQRFHETIGHAVAAGPPGATAPRLLDLGGRARSGIRDQAVTEGCDVTVFDLLAAPEVDVVGDAHAMSKHLPAEAFDFVHCVSLFEHLLMPWKVAVEMNRVMKTGGVALIHTHQTTGMHDLPWDFYRFSDTAWHGLFNAYTGFEVIESSMSNWMHIVPRAWQPRYRHAEHAGGFDSSSVLVRKTGAARVDWDVPLQAVLQTSYPTHADSNFT
jgi:SAM-dependent methyltransferase